MTKMIKLFKVEQYYKSDEEEKIKIYIGTISKFSLTHVLYNIQGVSKKRPFVFDRPYRVPEVDYKQK